METINAAIAAFAKGETNELNLKDLRKVDQLALKKSFDFWRNTDAPNAREMLWHWDENLFMLPHGLVLHTLCIRVEEEAGEKSYSSDASAGSAAQEIATVGWGVC